MATVASGRRRLPRRQAGLMNYNRQNPKVPRLDKNKAVDFIPYLIRLRQSIRMGIIPRLSKEVELMIYNSGG